MKKINELNEFLGYKGFDSIYDPEEQELAILNALENGDVFIEGLYGNTIQDFIGEAEIKLDEMNEDEEHSPEYIVMFEYLLDSLKEFEKGTY